MREGPAKSSAKALARSSAKALAERPAEEVVFGVVDPLPEVEPPMAAAFRDAIARLRDRGFTIEPIAIAPMLVSLDREAKIVMASEAAREHAARYEEHGDRLLDLADLVRQGLATPEGRYRAARAFINRTRIEMSARFATTPVILTPAAPGPAPRGLSSTGDARMNSPWTALGTPAISVPMPVGPDGLPLGLQLTAAPGEDARVLRAAARVWDALSGPR